MWIWTGRVATVGGAPVGLALLSRRESEGWITGVGVLRRGDGKVSRARCCGTSSHCAPAGLTVCGWKSWSRT